MWKHLLIVNVLTWAKLSGADICSHLPGYSYHGTSCYKLFENQKVWAAAEASCVADGGHLASIHSSEEQDFVAKLAGPTSPWIGLSGTPTNLAWSDGTAVDYNNWYATNPDENGVGCSNMRTANSHLWQDRICTFPKRYMCRIVDQTEARFMVVPGGMNTGPAVSPSSTHTVRSRVECAWRCQEDGDCKHFIMTDNGGKYLCDTYTTLYRASTPGSPPTNNYVKIHL